MPTPGPTSVHFRGLGSLIARPLAHAQPVVCLFFGPFSILVLFLDHLSLHGEGLQHLTLLAAAMRLASGYPLVISGTPSSSSDRRTSTPPAGLTAHGSCWHADTGDDLAILKADCALAVLRANVPTLAAKLLSPSAALAKLQPVTRAYCGLVEAAVYLRTDDNVQRLSQAYVVPACPFPGAGAATLTMMFKGFFCSREQLIEAARRAIEQAGDSKQSKKPAVRPPTRWGLLAVLPDLAALVEADLARAQGRVRDAQAASKRASGRLRAMMLGPRTTTATDIDRPRARAAIVGPGKAPGLDVRSCLLGSHTQRA